MLQHTLQRPRSGGNLRGVAPRTAAVSGGQSRERVARSSARAARRPAARAPAIRSAARLAATPSPRPFRWPRRSPWPLARDPDVLPRLGRRHHVDRRLTGSRDGGIEIRFPAWCRYRGSAEAPPAARPSRSDRRAADRTAPAHRATAPQVPATTRRRSTVRRPSRSRARPDRPSSLDAGSPSGRASTESLLVNAGQPARRLPGRAARPRADRSRRSAARPSLRCTARRRRRAPRAGRARAWPRRTRRARLPSARAAAPSPCCRSGPSATSRRSAARTALVLGDRCSGSRRTA